MFGCSTEYVYMQVVFSAMMHINTNIIEGSFRVILMNRKYLISSRQRQSNLSLENQEEILKDKSICCNLSLKPSFVCCSIIPHLTLQVFIKQWQTETGTYLAINF